MDVRLAVRLPVGEVEQRSARRPARARGTRPCRPVRRGGGGRRRVRSPRSPAAGRGPCPRGTCPRSPAAVGTPTRLPSMSYTQAWKGQVKRRASPEPSTTRTPRCRHTLAMARTPPSRSLVSRTGVPHRSTVQKRPGPRQGAGEAEQERGVGEERVELALEVFAGRVGGGRHLHDVLGHVGRPVLDVVEQATHQAVLERFPVHRDPLGPTGPSCPPDGSLPPAPRARLTAHRRAPRIQQSERPHST